MATPNEYAGATALVRLQRIQAALEEAAGDPMRAQAVARQAVAELYAVNSMLLTSPGAMLPPYARKGAQKIFRAPDVGQLESGQEVPTELRWPQKGWVLAMYGTVWSTDPNADILRLYAATEVSLKYAGGDRSLIVNGEDSDFAPFGGLFTLASPWFPLGLYVTGEDSTWQARLRNVLPDTEEASLAPTLLFSFVPDNRPSQGQ